MYYSKVYRKEKDVLLAVCDREVHNRTFENGNLRIHVAPSFYGEEEVEEERLKILFNEATIINLAGNMCIDLAKRLGYVDQENVIEIGDCPHAQVIKL